MSSALDALRATDQSNKHLIAVRVVAGAPLVFFGLMHLVNPNMPMTPLLEEAGLPYPGLMGVIAPIAQLLAGVLLLSGAFARIGGVLAIGTMLGALVTHMLIANDQWPTPGEDGVMAPGPEPVFMMGIAVVVLLAAAYVTWHGSGAWGLDAKASSDPAAPQPA